MSLFDSISSALGTDGGGGGLFGSISDLLGTSGKAGVGLFNDPTSMMAVAALAGGWGMGMFDGAMFGEAGAAGAAGGSAGAATEAAWAGGEAGAGAAGAAGAGAAETGAGAAGAGAGAGAAAESGYMGVGSSLGSGAGAGLPIQPSMWQNAMGALSQGWNTAKPWLKGATSGMQALTGLETMMAGRQRQQQQQQYAQQLQALMANPGSVTGIPGYEAGQEAVRRSMAAQGYQGSGNMMAALQNQGGQFYQQQLQNLGQLQGSSAGMPSFAQGATQFGAGLAGLASF